MYKYFFSFMFLLFFYLIGCSPLINYPDDYFVPLIIYDFGNKEESEFIPHQGIDIEGNIGDSVIAAANGIIVSSCWNYLGGNVIVIEHGENEKGEYILTLYAHNNKNLVKSGDIVQRGERIAELGSSGKDIDVPHLHFGVIITKNLKININTVQYANPHFYWVDGPYCITCYDSTRYFPKLPIRFTYPVKCRKK